MGDQIVDAALVAASRQRNAAAEEAAIEGGETAEVIWPGEPAKVRQKGGRGALGGRVF